MSSQAYQEGVLECITGEIYGIELFRVAAEVTSDTTVAHKCRLLQQLEESTFQRIHPLASKYGLKYSHAEHAESGAHNGQSLGTADWMEKMTKFQGDAVRDVARMEALLDITPEDDRGAIEYLVGHEKALAAFIDAEVAGEPNSLRHVTDFLNIENAGFENEM